MFFLLRDGKPTGPFTSDLLRQMLETGMVQPDDQVREENESEWCKITTVLGESEELPESVTETTHSAESDQPAPDSDGQPSFFSQLPDGGKIGVAIGGGFGFIADFLEPLAPLNLYLFFIALVSTAGLFISWRRMPVSARGDWGRMFPQQSLAFSAFVLISLTAWYCLGFLSGKSDRGVVAGNLPFVAKWQNSILGLQQDVEKIKETVGLVQKDTNEINQSAKNIETDTEQIRRDTFALKQETGAIKENTVGIRQATEATAKSMKQVDSNLESISQSVRGIGSLGGLIADPKTKLDYLHNADAYRKRNDLASARDAYLKYFALETGDFIDSYSGYWDLLESQYPGESKVPQLYQELLLEKPHSIAGPFVFLAAGASKNDEATAAKLIELYKANPEFIPALPVLASLIASNELYDLQRLSRIRKEYLRQGGFDAARKYLLRPSVSQNHWVSMLRNFGQPTDFDLSKFVSVDTYADQDIQLLGIEIRDVKPPQNMSLTFPDKTVVTVPFGADNPAGVDSHLVLFELKSGKQGRYRFEPRSPNDQRMFKHCGQLYGLDSTPAPVTVEIIDSRGRTIQLPKPLHLNFAQFTTKVVKPSPSALFRDDEGGKLQIIPAEFVKSCGISLVEDGPYVDVPMHVNVPTLREIRLQHITNLPLRAGQHHVWIKAETDRGVKLGPQLVTIEIPPGLPGLNGKLAPGPPKPPRTTPDAEWQVSAEALLKFSPDTRRLAVADHAESKAGTVIQVIDTRDGQIIATINHERVITTVAFSSNAEWLAAASSREKGRRKETDRDSVVTLTKIATGEQVRLTSDPDPVFALAFSPDDKIVAAGQRDSSRKSLIRLWNTTSHEETQKLTGYSAQQITCLAFSSGGQHLAASNGQSGVGDVMIWDTTTGKPKDTYRGDREGTASLVFSPSGDQLLVASNRSSPSVRLWDLQTGENLASQFPTGGRPTTVAFGDETLPLIAQALNGRQVTVWNALSGLKIIELKHYGLKTIALSPDGRILVTGGKTVKIWSLDNPRGPSL